MRIILQLLGAFIAGAVIASAVFVGMLTRGQSRWWTYAPPRPQLLVSVGRDASSKAWYDYAGHFSSVAFLRDDQLNGAAIKFHTNGEIAEVGRYSTGKRDGEWIAFLPDGTAAWRAQFVNDVVVSGEWPRERSQ
jgi:hypothetical protein